MLPIPMGRLKLRSTGGPPSEAIISCSPAGQPSPKLSCSCIVTPAIASSDGAVEGGKYDPTDGGDGAAVGNEGGGAGSNDGTMAGGGKDGRKGCKEGGCGDFSGQVGAPKAASMKFAARAYFWLTREISVPVSKRVACCARRPANAWRSCTALRWVGTWGDCSQSFTVVALSATAQSEATSTRHDDVLSRAWAMRPCNRGRKPLCSREVSWISVHSAGAGGGNEGGGCAGGGLDGDGGGGDGGCGPGGGGDGGGK